MSLSIVLGQAGKVKAQIDPATVTTGHVYLFDNVSDGNVPDDSANELTGIIVGNPQVVGSPNGKALLFDGVDDGVDIPDSEFINVTNGPWSNRTVIAVFRCDDVNKSEKQTVFEEGGRTRGLTIYVHEGLVYVGAWNRAEYMWNGSWISAPINSYETHAVALVIRDGTDAVEDGKFEMWMDGILIGTAPGGQMYNHGNDNAIGYTKQNNVFHDDEGSGDGWYFEGAIDEVWILNDALTETDLANFVGEPWPYAFRPTPADGAAGVSPLPAVSTFVSSDVPKNIPDWSATTSKNIDGEVSSTLDVAESIKINDLNVELDITKPGNNADLNAFLKSPDGKEVKLFDDVGFNRPSNFKNTILDDEAGTSITSGAGPFTGIYKPEGKLSDFDGRNTNGTWRLKVIDDWPGGAGRINSWRIVVENPVTVRWMPGTGDSQDVYFSSSFEDVNDSMALLGNVAGDAGMIEVGTLEYGTTYYWRVDTVDSNGVAYNGKIWSFSTPNGTVEVNQRIADGMDDVEEQIATLGVLDITSSDLEFAYEYEGQADPQLLGMRFVDVGIPAATHIIESYIEFEVDETKGGTDPVNVLIGGELSPDAAPFVDEQYNVSNRTLADAMVPWSVPDWTVEDEKFQSPDLSALVEQLVGQNGWAAGNAMVFTIQDDPDNPSLGVRAAESYDGEPDAAPLLHVVGLIEVADNPSPADGAIDVLPETILAWSPGFTGVSRDVYFGTENPPAKLETTTGTTFDAGMLATSTTYYWRIDEVDASGKKHTGPVWSFSTVIVEATEPEPADASMDMPLDVTLSWTAGYYAVSHDVYFGAGDALDFIGNQEENTYTPEGLAEDTTYSWRIDEVDADGTIHVGVTWSFTTVPPAPVLTVGPLSSLEVEVDPADPNTLLSLLKINEIDVNDLVLGTTTTDFEKHAGNEAFHADNFSLADYASLDDSTVIQTIFTQPVTTVFIMERGANDSGFFQAIDADGNPVSEMVAFAPADFQLPEAGLKIVNQTAGGLAIESTRPIAGLLILPPEGALHSIDPASISGVPAP